MSRLGIDSFVAEEYLICIYGANCGSHWGAVPFVYRLPCFQLARLRQYLVPQDTEP